MSDGYAEWGKIELTLPETKAAIREPANLEALLPEMASGRSRPAGTRSCNGAFGGLQSVCLRRAKEPWTAPASFAFFDVHPSSSLMIRDVSVTAAKAGGAPPPGDCTMGLRH
jgi:hypothetical protein